MRSAKLPILLVFIAFALAACFSSKPERYTITDSRAYEASLFRQHCAVCHGPEAEGKTLDNGTKVPSLREADFKFRTEAEIFKQITDGGNGMAPFRDQLTDGERHRMAAFVHDQLRSAQDHPQ